MDRRAGKAARAAHAAAATAFPSASEPNVPGDGKGAAPDARFFPAGSAPAAAPHAFARRVLFLVAGLTPQIVTETLFALCHRAPDPFLPTEVHLLTTTEGSRRARLMLLEGQGRFYRFCEDYRLPQLAKAFDETRIHLVRGADGTPLDDIVTAGDNAAVADTIMHYIRTFTSDPDCALHASVAGGRKTMGVALALAMSLFGRPQDALSHVLVSPPFESHPDFFYPPPQPQVLLVGAPPQQRPVSTAEARVSLAEIPLLKLRDLLDEALLAEDCSFSALIERAQTSFAAPRLVIDLARSSVQANGQQLDLKPAAKAFLLMLARRKLLEKATHCPAEGAPDAALAREFLQAFADINAEPPTEQTRKALKDGMDKNYFERRKHEVNSALRKALGPGPAKACEIGRRHDAASGRYCHDLPLKPEQVRIIDEGR